jgi:hypothetical protein
MFGLSGVVAAQHKQRQLKAGPGHRIQKEPRKIARNQVGPYFHALMK